MKLFFGIFLIVTGSLCAIMNGLRGIDYAHMENLAGVVWIIFLMLGNFFSTFIGVVVVKDEL